MNTQIDNAVKRCFECQIATRISPTEPAKMTNLPARPREVVEADFCGPFPNREYALVLTDQYSRYPEVEFTKSTSFEGTREKLKKIFSTHGVPQTIQPDNGAPFTSRAFSEFAHETGFQHKHIRPKHPKAQGQVERFNKLVNKITAIVKQANTNPHKAIHDMLQAYRSSPHPATKKPPYELLMNREVRTKLDHFPTTTLINDQEVRANDRSYKEIVKNTTTDGTTPRNTH